MSAPLSTTILYAYALGAGNPTLTDIKSISPIKENTMFSHTMAIPLHRKTLDIPVFLANRWVSVWDEMYHNKEKKCDYLSFPLIEIRERYRYFRTVGAAVKTYFQFNYNAGLFKVYAKPGNVVYYMTRGAIFDEHFNPIMVQSWRFSKDTEWEIDTTENKCVMKPEKLHLECPCMWIDPTVLMDKSDTVRKLIASKFLPIAGHYTDIPCCLKHMDSICTSNCWSMPVRIIIDEWPYKIKRVSAPSISTTNDVLIQTVLDHIDEAG